MSMNASPTLLKKLDSACCAVMEPLMTPWNAVPKAPEIVLATLVATVPKLVISAYCFWSSAAVLANIACGVFCAATNSAVLAS